jgi:hypothetical protein
MSSGVRAHWPMIVPVETGRHAKKILATLKKMAEGK